MSLSWRAWLLAAVLVAGLEAASPQAAGDSLPAPSWSAVRPVRLPGDWRVFWNVGGGDVGPNNREAAARGFRPVTLINTYSDYPGKQKENINTALAGNRTDPWKKPDFFERIVRRNTREAGQGGDLIVQDIEFAFEDDAAKAWQDPAARAASGARTPEEFAKAYYREWASWFALPCRWVHECRPGSKVGLYGPQPFRRDYWGVAGKTAQQIDGTHRSDAELWKFIEPDVDFAIASVYVFYDDPGSVYYIAANVEENVARMRACPGKPVYAYEWLRYHDSNKALRGKELAPYLVEAMAVVPYFSGAKGVVLWGWEPKTKGQPYERLPLFTESLGRLGELPAGVAKGEVQMDEPAHVLWKEKRPLVRKIRVAEGEWAVMAVNPWQKEEARGSIEVQCGADTVTVPLVGRRTGVFLVRGGKVARELGVGGRP